MDEIRMNLSGEVESLLMTFVDRAAGIDKLSKSAVGEARGALLTPLFTPILVNKGFDPIHFGVLMVTIVTMGSNTPPIGVSMFTVCGMLDCSVKEYIRGSTPFLLVMLATFLLMALVPGIVTWLPNTAMGN